MGFGVIAWILLIVAVVWGVRYFAYQNKRPHDDVHGKGSERPLDILKEHYARGELNEQEFEKRKRVLQEE